MTSSSFDENDYGFSSVTPDEIRPPDPRAKQLYDIIMPLLQNLLKDADTSDFIKWPNRRKVIEEQISKINKIMNG